MKYNYFHIAQNRIYPRILILGTKGSVIACKSLVCLQSMGHIPISGS